MLTIFKGKLFFAALFISTGIYAQQMVSGSITDEEGTPLPGASVIIQGTDQGVTTDFDGNYSISIDRGQTLEASFIGYKTATSVVGE